MTCSLNMISSTEAAKPVPRAIENWLVPSTLGRYVLRFASG